MCIVAVLLLQNACETLRERLEPYRLQYPRATWRELASYYTVLYARILDPLYELQFGTSEIPQLKLFGEIII